MRITKLLFVLCSMCLFFGPASTVYSASKRIPQGIRVLSNKWINGNRCKWINGNRWEILTSNYGPCALPLGGNPAGYWPKGSGHNYIYGAGLWVGATDPGLAKRVAVGYNPNSGAYEFGPISLDGNEATGETDPKARVYLSTDPTDLAEWPIKNAGGGDSIVSQQDGFAMYNDLDTQYTFSGDKVAGVEVRQTSYVWTFYDMQDIVLFQFDVKNVRPDSAMLDSVYLGICADNDIGNEAGSAANDLVGFDVSRNLGMQWQNTPESGWDTTGVVGMRFFQSPINNTGDTVRIIDDVYSRKIPPDSALGMTGFKIFTIEIDPQTDAERYRMMQGFNYLTMVMDAYDVDTYGPGDKRFIQCTGPFKLAHDSTARVVVGYIAAKDTVELKQKSDVAQTIYDNIYNPQVSVSLQAPNGGQIWSGTQNITWTSSGSVAPSCSADIYYSRDGGSTWNLMIANLPNSGSYAWNTTTLPDGVRYKIEIYLHNGQIAAWDGSDSVFTVNNPGNAVPEVMLYSPNGGEVWSGSQDIVWKFGDADGDLLTISLDYTRDGGLSWNPITSLPGSSQYWKQATQSWDTTKEPNDNKYRLRVSVSDASLTASDTSNANFTISNPHDPAGTVNHPSGSANTITVNPYILYPAQVTGHLYELRFKEITKNTTAGNNYTSFYTYDLWDVNLSTIVMPDRKISVSQTGTEVWDVPDPVDGVVVETKTKVDRTTFSADSFKITQDVNIQNPPSADTLVVNTSIDQYWPWRSADYEIRWHVIEGPADTLDTLWAEVWDISNNVLVPFDSLTYSGLKKSSWAFGTTATIKGRNYITSSTVGAAGNARKWMYLCGTILYFNRGATIRRPMTWATKPEEGEIWTAYTSGDRPPHDGDVYSFQTTVGVEEQQNAECGMRNAECRLMQNYPNPFTSQTAIRYSLSAISHTTLKIYNIAGQLVRSLVNEPKSPGVYSVRWNGRDESGKQMASGVYFYRLTAGDFNAVKKMIIIR